MCPGPGGKHQPHKGSTRRPCSWQLWRVPQQGPAPPLRIFYQFYTKQHWTRWSMSIQALSRATAIILLQNCPSLLSPQPAPPSSFLLLSVSQCLFPLLLPGPQKKGKGKPSIKQENRSLVLTTITFIFIAKREIPN